MVNAVATSMTAFAAAALTLQQQQRDGPRTTPSVSSTTRILMTSTATPAAPTGPQRASVRLRCCRMIASTSQLQQRIQQQQQQQQTTVLRRQRRMLTALFGSASARGEDEFSSSEGEDQQQEQAQRQRKNRRDEDDGGDNDELLMMDDEFEDEDEQFLRRELEHLEALEEILAELGYDDDDDDNDDSEDDHELEETDNERTREDGNGRIRLKQQQGDDDHGDDDDNWGVWTEDSLSELFSSLDDDDEEEEENDIVATTRPQSTTPIYNYKTVSSVSNPSLTTRNLQNTNNNNNNNRFVALEQALSQGVVPVSARVGTDCLPGDFGFDPFGLADKDYFQLVQSKLLKLFPSRTEGDDVTASAASSSPSSLDSSSSGQPLPDGTTTNSGRQQQRHQQRPRALILRDYREAEIRHSRLAMLAAVIWPLQELVDRFVLKLDQAYPLVYGPVTLPYFPLGMTLILLLLGYLDIYSQAIKDMDQIGDAYLPGDCFWDPLNILPQVGDIATTSPPAERMPQQQNLGSIDYDENDDDEDDTIQNYSALAAADVDGMKRRMQERELFNGRAAMLAVLAYTWEELVTHKAVVDIPSNLVLFTPLYQLPVVQEWLDAQFSDHYISTLSQATTTCIAMQTMIHI